MIKRIIHNAGIAALIWAAFIFVLCATPGRYIPSPSWLEILSFDKFVHASVFFVLCGLGIVSVASRNGFLFIAGVFFSCVLYGAALEWMQAHWFSERSADVLDIAANTVGCLMALLFTGRLRRLQSQYV